MHQAVGRGGQKEGDAGREREEEDEVREKTTTEAK